jgi:hypothetical protein
VTCGSCVIHGEDPVRFAGEDRLRVLLEHRKFVGFFKERYLGLLWIEEILEEK